MRRTLVLGLLTIAWAPPVCAQPAAPVVTMTLDQAIAAGLSNSRRLAELQARLEAAGFAVDEQRAADRPDVNLAGGYTRTNHVDVFVIAAPGRPPQVVYPDIPDNYRTRV